MYSGQEFSQCFVLCTVREKASEVKKVLGRNGFFFSINWY